MSNVRLESSSTNVQDQTSIILSLEEEKDQLEEANMQLSDEMTNITDELMSQSQTIKDLEASVQSRDDSIALLKMELDIAKVEVMNLMTYKDENKQEKELIERKVDELKAERVLMKEKMEMNATLLHSIEESLLTMKSYLQCKINV